MTDDNNSNIPELHHRYTCRAEQHDRDQYEDSNNKQFYHANIHQDKANVAKLHIKPH